MSKMWSEIARSYGLENYAVQIKAVPAQASADAGESKAAPASAGAGQCFEAVLRRRLRLPLGLGVPLGEVERVRASTPERALSRAITRAVYWSGRDAMQPESAAWGVVTILSSVAVWAAVVGVLVLVIG